MASQEKIYSINKITNSDILCIKPLFETVFKVSVDLDLLHWKYGQERGISWGVWANDLLLLHCGLFFRNVFFQEKCIQGAQLVDLMAAPKQGGLTRGQSPFGLLMSHVLETLPGPRNPEGLAFGFPSARAMQLGERLGVYASVDDCYELEFQPRVSRYGAQAKQTDTWSESDIATVNRLWNRMRVELASFAVCERNFDYIHRRYLSHPTKKYALLIVRSRWRRTPLGLAVLNLEHEKYELLDAIGAQEDLPDLFSAVQQWISKLYNRSFFMMLTSTFSRHFESLADQVRPTQFRVMANPRMPSASLDRLNQRWWLTGGDTDYR